MILKDAHRAAAKVYFTPASAAVDPEELYLTLKRWVDRDSPPAGERVMIDAANRAHVAWGPKAALVCHTGLYLIDDDDGRLGLRYRGRRDEPATVDERLLLAMRRALAAASRLTAELKALELDPQRLSLLLYDQLAAPNDDQHYQALRIHGEHLLVNNADVAVAGAHHYAIDPRATLGVTFSISALPRAATGVWS